MRKTLLYLFTLVTLFTQPLVVESKAFQQVAEEVLINEDFEDNSYEQHWILTTVEGNRSWQLKTYNDNTYMQMSGHNGNVSKFKTYLITPQIDFDSYDNEVLTFKTKNGYYKGVALTVWVSSDFDGNHADAATWVQLSASVDERNNTSSYGEGFVESGDVDLSSFTGKGYIAFKYEGNNSSLTTTYQVDDVVVTGVQKNYEGTLISNLITNQIDFDYIPLSQESSVKEYTLSFTDVTGNIEITSPADYLISEDGTKWSKELSLSSGSGDGMVDVKVKYAPERQYYVSMEQVIEHKVSGAFPYKLKVKSKDAFIRQDATTLQKEATLDIVTWNLQFFGAPNKSSNASTFDEQLTSVSTKIIDMDADIYALQEVVVDALNGDYFTELLNKINELAGEDKYAGVVAPRYSLYYNAPSTNFPAQRLCFIYDVTKVSNIHSESMFSDFYNGSSTPTIEGYPGSESLFWSSGRLPQLMQAIVNIKGETELIHFINIHAKCCGDGSERREADAAYLMDELQNNYPDDNVLILGDYNDNYSNVTGPYAPWYANENKDYLHIAGERIDHVSISDELYDEHYALTNNSSTDNVSISDHDPVMVRLHINNNKESQTVTIEDIADYKVGDVVQLSGSATSNLKLSYAVESGKATITDDQLKINGAGEILVRAAQKGNDQYAPAFSEVTSFNVDKGDQTITFDEIPTKTAADDPFQLTASATSGLSVSFEVVSGGVTIQGKTVTIVSEGEVTIKAKQLGNSDFNPAPEVTQTFLVEEKNGIEDLYASQVSLYPNPTIGKVNLSTPDMDKKKVKLVGLSGKTILETTMFGSQMVLHVNDLPNGLYFVQITSGNITIAKKLQIQR